VVWTVVLAVVKTQPRVAWDEPSAGSSFSGLFLGGISQVFFRAHKRWGTNVGIRKPGANELQRG
jgi:hypothetical protein